MEGEAPRRLAIVRTPPETNAKQCHCHAPGTNKNNILKTCKIRPAFCISFYMKPFTQLLCGMAAAGVAVGPQHPAALIAGGVAAILPEIIDWWQREVFRKPVITVTPDPHTPTPTIPAQGMRAVLHHARTSGQPCVIRFNPLPSIHGGCTTYQLDYDQHHCFVATIDHGRASVPVDPQGRPNTSDPFFTPRHPLPLQITTAAVDLLLTPCGKRIISRDLQRVAGVGHSLPVAGALILLILVCNPVCGIAMTAAGFLHLLLDLGGRRELVPWGPFSDQSWQGRRLWDDQGWRANLIAGALALGILTAIARIDI